MARVEAVIKIGGSLAEQDALASLCCRVSELAQQHRLLVIPGGGPFADTVRHYYRRWQLSETAADRMAILAMDQYGYLLCDLIGGAVPITSLVSIEAVCRAGQVPVLIPSQLMFHADPLPHSWAVTSDSIAAWVATLAGPARLILLKGVDGYHAEPAPAGRGQLLAEVTPDELAGCHLVDEHLAAILNATPIDTWILNGTAPERLAELLTVGRTRGTHVRPG